jgi:hypothetical protein
MMTAGGGGGRWQQQWWWSTTAAVNDHGGQLQWRLKTTVMVGGGDSGSGSRQRQ